MIRNISTEVSIFINHVLIPVYSLITEFLVLFGIIILILFVELKIGIYILTTSIFTFNFKIGISKEIKYVGS